MVGVTGFEPAASTSQTSRATNCATPRCVKNIRFLVNFRKWSNLWSKHFVGVFLKRVMPEKVSIYKGFQRFGKLTAGDRLHAPKRRALPTAPHPDVFVPIYYTTKKCDCLHFFVNRSIFILFLLRICSPMIDFSVRACYNIMKLFLFGGFYEDQGCDF